MMRLALAWSQLAIDDGRLLFRIPSALAPAKKEAAQQQATQQTTSTLAASADTLPGGVSVIVRLEAPSEVSLPRPLRPPRRRACRACDGRPEVLTQF